MAKKRYWRRRKSHTEAVNSALKQAKVREVRNLVRKIQVARKKLAELYGTGETSGVEKRIQRLEADLDLAKVFQSADILVDSP